VTVIWERRCESDVASEKLFQLIYDLQLCRVTALENELNAEAHDLNMVILKAFIRQLELSIPKVAA
jgi:hypothetical protein